jgi:hypothetical protein
VNIQAKTAIFYILKNDMDTMQTTKIKFLWVLKRIDKRFHDTTYNKSGRRKSRWAIGLKRTKKKTDRNAKESPHIQHKRVSTHAQELRICRCVTGKWNFVR